MTLRVVFAGTPQFAVPPLAALARSHRIVGVLTQPDRPAGRGRVLTASPVKQFALEQEFEIAQPLSLRTGASATLARLGDWRPDVIVVVAYGLILPQALLDLPRYGCINIHASLLPRWRGAAPIQRAILAGDTQSGITLMQMDAGLDTGAMLASRAVPLGPRVIAADLHDELAALGASLIVDLLAKLPTGVHAAPQPVDGVTYAAKLSKLESSIDWRLPAAQIDRQIRAFNPWPVAQTSWRSEPLKLLRSHVAVASGGTIAPPGTVLGLAGDVIEVRCGDGVLAVTELQRAGRRKVSARDFANAERLAASLQGAGAVFA